MPSREPLTEQDVEPITRILFIDKMKDLKKHCRDATIERAAFVKFILACQQGLLPWRHQILHREFVPAQVTPTPSDFEALTDNGGGPLGKDASRALNKIFTMFQVRRLLVGHIFYNDDLSNWHFFYFDQRDSDEDVNHWVGGSHLHLINHLWPNHSATKLWDHFRSGNVQMTGSLHIRFRDSRKK